MGRKLGKIGLGVVIFVGWLCFVLFLQSIGTTVEVEGESSGSNMSPIVHDAVITIGDATAMLQHTLQEIIVGEVRNILTNEGALPPSLMSEIDQRGIIVAVEAIRYMDDHPPDYMEKPRVRQTRRLQCDLRLQYKNNTLLLPNVPLEAGYYIDITAQEMVSRVDVTRAYPFIALPDGRIATTNSGTIQLYKSTLLRDGDPRRIPTTGPEDQVLGLTYADGVGWAAMLRGPNERHTIYSESLLLTFDFDGYAVFLFPNNGVMGDVSDDDTFVRGSVKIDILDNRYFIVRHHDHNDAPIIFYDVTEFGEGPYVLSEVFDLPFAWTNQGNEHRISLYTLDKEILWTRWAAPYFAICWRDGVPIQYSQLDEPRQDMDVRNTLRPSVDWQDAQVQIIGTDHAQGFVVDKQGQTFVFDFIYRSLALQSERILTVLAVSSSGRYQVYTDSPVVDRDVPHILYLVDENTQHTVRMEHLYRLGDDVFFVRDHTVVARIFDRLYYHSTIDGRPLGVVLEVPDNFLDGEYAQPDNDFAYILGVYFDEVSGRLTVLTDSYRMQWTHMAITGDIVVFVYDEQGVPLDIIETKLPTIGRTPARNMAIVGDIFTFMLQPDDEISFMITYRVNLSTYECTVDEVWPSSWTQQDRGEYVAEMMSDYVGDSTYESYE